MTELFELLRLIGPEHWVISALLVALSVIVGLYIKLRKNNRTDADADQMRRGAEQKLRHEEDEHDMLMDDETRARFNKILSDTVAELQRVTSVQRELIIKEQICQGVQARQAEEIAALQKDVGSLRSENVTLRNRVNELERGAA